ncbi:MAG: hypothetical protein ACK5XN_18160, partial [Bacteroidota bacterium]
QMHNGRSPGPPFPSASARKGKGRPFRRPNDASTQMHKWHSVVMSSARKRQTRHTLALSPHYTSP